MMNYSNSSVILVTKVSVFGTPVSSYILKAPADVPVTYNILFRDVNADYTRKPTI